MPDKDDPIYRHYLELWFEIRRLLPYHRRLLNLGDRRTPKQDRELTEIGARLVYLRQRTTRYAEVFRYEEKTGS